MYFSLRMQNKANSRKAFVVHFFILYERENRPKKRLKKPRKFPFAGFGNLFKIIFIYYNSVQCFRIIIKRVEDFIYYALNEIEYIFLLNFLFLGNSFLKTGFHL